MNSKFSIDDVRFNEDNLVAVIAQDAQDGTILMLAWANRASLIKTTETGEMWYWSRSRKQLWHKGATSGHRQRVRALLLDCDGDAIVAKIEQIGGIACHTGARSCFFRELPHAEIGTVSR
ncbi:MAG: phosphoribosyl-AMP cyclohydrolase [Actinomycetia bacterium]|nr:phosphoribosyl-AMP cyclohydrolase [Actinomycetes bacterium]